MSSYRTDFDRMPRDKRFVLLVLEQGKIKPVIAFWYIHKDSVFYTNPLVSDFELVEEKDGWIYRGFWYTDEAETYDGEYQYIGYSRIRRINMVGWMELPSYDNL